MEKDRPIERQRCKAMKDADIESPVSQDGIDFCVKNCPYTYCVVVEHRQTAAQVKGRQRVLFAKRLKRHGVSVDDIALILEKSVGTIVGYLRR